MEITPACLHDQCKIVEILTKLKIPNDKRKQQKCKIFIDIT